MKRAVLILLILIAPLIFFIGLPEANAVENERTVVLAGDEIINNDYVVAGETVAINGTVNGDVYVASGNLNVEGTINGDLLAAGGNINIRGNVTGNVRAIGGTILLTGEVGRNFSTVGGTVNLTDSAVVGGSITSAGGMLALYGSVGGDVRVAGGQITFGNNVGEDVYAAAEQITVSQNSTIGGSFTYWSNQEAQIIQGAVIAGQVSQNKFPQAKDPVSKTDLAASIASFMAFWKIISIISMLVIGLLIIKFFPSSIQKIFAVTRRNFWSRTGIGFVSIILIPVAIIILLITIIGIPLAIFIAMIFAILIYLGSVIASLIIGKWVLGRFNKNSMIWSLIIGILIYEIINIIPIFGWVISLIFFSTAIGAVLIEVRQSYIDLRVKKLI